MSLYRIRMQPRLNPVRPAVFVDDPKIRGDGTAIDRARSLENKLGDIYIVALFKTVARKSVWIDHTQSIP